MRCTFTLWKQRVQNIQINPSSEIPRQMSHFSMYQVVTNGQHFQCIKWLVNIVFDILMLTFENNNDNNFDIITF